MTPRSSLSHGAWMAYSYGKWLASSSRRREKVAAQGLTASEAWNHLGRFLACWPLIAPSPAVLDQARVLHVEQQWSFWDALIVAACLDAGVACLYSEDLPGRSLPGRLEVINPFA